MGTTTNRRYSEKYLPQNYKDNMLRNSDMMVYALQLKQKFTANVFRTATIENNFRGCFWKENRGRKGCAVTLVVSGFYFFLGIYLLSHETIFFLH